MLSEILQTNPDLEENQRSHFLNTVIKETDRLTRLVNEVLDLERFESGRYLLNFETVQLEDVIKESLNAIEQLAKDKSVKIQYSVESTLPAIEGDRDRLMQVFINLISNSIKFCYPEIGIIKIQVSQNYPTVRIQIIDNGIGIDPQFHELIFDKFYQTTDQSIRKPKGSGLGLAITKKIIELHQGTIKIESKPEQGATFTFEIPIGQTKTI